MGPRPAGNGTSGHLAAEVFKRATGITALHVPYRGGAHAMIDMMGGRISSMFLDPVQVMPQIRSGQFRALAVSAPGRLNLVPAHTNAGIVTGLNTEIEKALHADTVRDTLLAMGVVIQGGSPQAFGTFLTSETERWAKAIKAVTIKAD